MQPAEVIYLFYLMQTTLFSAHQPLPEAWHCEQTQPQGNSNALSLNVTM